MKKFVVIITAALALSACHYGKKEAGASLERNKEYKDAKAADQGPEINPDYVKSNGGAATTVAAADTTKPATEETPAAPASH
jgi:hypothetical protein